MISVVSLSFLIYSPVSSIYKSVNNCSPNLLLLKVVHLYQDYNSSDNQVSSTYGMANMTIINRNKRSK